MELESSNTMFQNAFHKNGDGDYSLKTTSTENAAGIGFATSPNTSGVVSAPGAGAAIATTSSEPAGVYDVTVTAFIGGTTATSDINNIRLLAGGNQVGRMICPIPGTTGANGNSVSTFRVNLASAGTFSCVAVAAATAGSVYAVSIIARQVQ